MEKIKIWTDKKGDEKIDIHCNLQELFAYGIKLITQAQKEFEKNLPKSKRKTTRQMIEFLVEQGYFKNN